MTSLLYIVHARSWSESSLGLRVRRLQKDKVCGLQKQCSVHPPESAVSRLSTTPPHKQLTSHRSQRCCCRHCLASLSKQVAFEQGCTAVRSGERSPHKPRATNFSCTPMNTKTVVISSKDTQPTPLQLTFPMVTAICCFATIPQRQAQQSEVWWVCYSELV